MNKFIIIPNPKIAILFRVQLISVSSKFIKTKATALIMKLVMVFLSASKTCAINVFSLSRLGIIFTPLTFAMFAHAQEMENVLSSNKVTLTIKPHICVAPRGETSCLSTIDISWSSTNNDDYCLASDMTKNPLQCWQSNNTGFYQHKLIFDKSITYLINHEPSKITLANAEMKFKTLKPHRKYKKRRSRFPWSISSL